MLGWSGAWWTAMARGAAPPGEASLAGGEVGGGKCRAANGDKRTETHPPSSEHRYFSVGLACFGGPGPVIFSRNTAHQPLSEYGPSSSCRVVFESAPKTLMRLTGRTPPKPKEEDDAHETKQQRGEEARGGRAHQPELKHVSCPIPSSAVCMRTLD